MKNLLNKPIHQEISDLIREGNLIKLSQIIEENPQYLEFEALGGWLNYASKHGTLEMVKYLIDKGLDVNKGDFEGVAPLCSAASGGHYDVVEYLLDHGAAIDISASVRNPLFAAITESIKDKMNKTWAPPTGEAPAIIRLLLERGIDAMHRYNTKTMKNMDAVAFAMMMGARECARIIALWNCNGDEAAAEAAMAEGWEISHRNTKPVPKGEQVKPS